MLQKDFSSGIEENVTGIHEDQLLSYLKLSDCTRGLLINFNVKILKDGIKRMKK